MPHSQQTPSHKNSQRAYAGGFADPVFQSQAVFRALMDAMARPGRIQTLDDSVDPPAPFSRAMGAVALTLLDADTAVWLTPAARASVVPSWISFHSGARVTEDKAAAQFAFVEAGQSLPPLSSFALGTQDYPDRSTTLVVELPALGGGAPLLARGPGIETTQTIAPSGLPPIFTTLWRDNRALFPRGVDLILTAGSDLLCLPRSTSLQTAEE
ncbi:alpha-D-ribose 1-methylphosphonate 5-triphosphate synthase subunit PhnH [Rhizobium sp. RU20A]|uniref:phosphonate C-P lyase system protein PhnH n=1 Tax=Rhizobium sp. RU20A TaxID=1907412 RepID=UPI000954DED7|nr:phosphonate C-P lyase system protein PhnH [Rhizobium sp. RU20A]SIR29200.1 alpha-D-ribose 1-methylphosphonate 5-triphosphate synthase subunit PhnH [Rhizobium sp. RU20A]